VGDGRAILLGEVIDRVGVRRDIQFKGARYMVERSLVQPASRGRVGALSFNAAGATNKKHGSNLRAVSGNCLPPRRSLASQRRLEVLA
jgi:hypothetical protein